MCPQGKLVHLQQLLLCYICLTFLFNVHFFKFFYVNQCEITSLSFPSCNQVLAITARCCFHYNPNPFFHKVSMFNYQKHSLLSFQLPDLNAFIIYFTLTSCLSTNMACLITPECLPLCALHFLFLFLLQSVLYPQTRSVQNTTIHFSV